MDVIGSDASEPPGGPPSRVLRRLRQIRVRVRRVPRAALVGAGVLAAVAVVLGLKAGAGPVVPAVPDPTPVAALPTGPFDRLPGRTPIPEPSRSADRLSGELPPLGGPGKASAVQAVKLVLGRYCLRPERYTIGVSPQNGYQFLGAVAFGLDRGNDGPSVDLLLSWTGRTYAWTGSFVQLRAC